MKIDVSALRSLLFSVENAIDEIEMNGDIDTIKSAIEGGANSAMELEDAFWELLDEVQEKENEASEE